MELVIVFSLMSVIEGLNFKMSFKMDAKCFTPVLCNWDNEKFHQMEAKFFNPWSSTKFLLVNRNVSNRLIELNDYSSLSWSMFDRTLPTKVIIHGFLNSDESSMNKAISDAYIRNHDVNVIKGELNDCDFGIT